jgi:hypothetical protein
LVISRRYFRFKGKVKDLDRQYEINNNAELDNGVYNKFMYNSNEDGDKEEGDKLAQEDSLMSSIRNQNLDDDEDEEAEDADVQRKIN